MEAIREQKCPACGAPLRFDAASGKLMCDYCGTEVEMKQTQDGKRPVKQPEALEGFDFAQLSAHASPDGAEALPVYNCVSCGAEVISSPTQAALTCPYCGNNIVLTQQLSGKLRPDGVIPFSITSESLPQSVRRYFRDKKLLPRGFFNDAAIGKVTGIYVPFWVFDGEVSGTLHYAATTSASHRRGDYVVTTTKHYKLVREGAMSFQNLPVDASSGIEDKMMDSLEPFQMSQVKPFDMGYLAGYTAERFDQGKDTVALRAQHRMRSTASAVITSRSTAGYSDVHQNGGGLRAKLKARYLLFPVYMFDVLHGNRHYPFVVNGQTGRVVGKLPMDPAVSRRFFLLRFALISGGLFALSVVRYLVMGG